MPIEQHYDVIVIGAGAAGMTAACVAATEGLSTLLLEKSAWVGGTTAISGGMVWIPGNSKWPPERQGEDLAGARTYLGHTLPAAHDRGLVEAYLGRAAEAIDYLEARTSVAFRPVAFYPDYYPDLPGAARGGRVLEPQAFDARALGAHFGLLRAPLPEFMLFGGMMVDRADIPHLRRATRSLRSAARVARIVTRYAWDRLSFERGAHLVLGNALAARLLKSALDAGVALHRSQPKVTLLRAGARVEGVALGEARAIRARKAVILAAGGFSHDPELRARYFPSNAGRSSAACSTDSGDGIRLGIEAGGRIGAENANNAFWVPCSRFERAGGTPAVYPHTVTDRGKPGVIAVDAQGRRFVNEALSYHEFVQAMLRTNTVPAWLVCDRAALWRYGLGAIRPFTRSVAPYLRSGYLVRGSSLGALARALALEPSALEATVARYNANARNGVDPDFGKGSNAYHRYVGDPAHQPNPCVAPLDEPPYFALALYPGDLGTSAGLCTNAHGQVLAQDGASIGGLYACGNDMNSIMCGAYPGPGITLGPALTFGYIAALHAAR
ncbi:MAG: FAD-dependent oxidoreductase [Burkholderiales bacterium]|nr:FAD-dependent oxidoreductase [Burkholderiales bacterium]